MQRLHHQDFTGHLIEKNLGYEVLKLSGRDGHEELEQAKKDLGSYGFAGQHQQEPSPRSGGIIKRAWIKYYNELPDNLEEKIIVADFTVIEISDW